MKISPVKKIFSTFEYTKITYFRYTSIIKTLHTCLRKRGETRQSIVVDSPRQEGRN